MTAKLLKPTNFPEGVGARPGETLQLTGGIPGGDVVIQPGPAKGAVPAGHVLITNIGTVDPHVVGALWIDTTAADVLKVSQG